MKRIKITESKFQLLSKNKIDFKKYRPVTNLIYGLLKKPSTHKLDPYFSENGITWSDIISYLREKEIVGLDSNGDIRLKNYFKTKFDSNEIEAKRQKEEDVKKIISKILKDNDAPWNKRAKEANNDETNHSNINKELFRCFGMNKEIAILNGDDGDYVFSYENIGDNKTDISEEEITQYINTNFDNLEIGEGSKDFNTNEFEDGKIIVKLDEHLREEIANLYSKDKNFVHLLNRIAEMTSAGSSGAFAGPMGAKPKIDLGNSPADELNPIDESINNLNPTGGIFVKHSAKNIDSMPLGKDITTYDKVANVPPDKKITVYRGVPKHINKIVSGDFITTNKQLAKDYAGTGKVLSKNVRADEILDSISEPNGEEYILRLKNSIDETTTAAGGSPQSSSTGPYTAPLTFFKNPKSAKKKTTYPNGEFVDFDPCTKLNNNKKAQNGGCSVGAVDGVVKTHKTKDSVLHEIIAKKTGKTLEEVKKIIDKKFFLIKN